MANQTIHNPLYALKFAYATVTTESIAPDQNGSVNVVMPSGGTSIKAVIPYGESPNSHWTSRLIYVQANNSTIYYRCIGTGASQPFAIRYVVIYV